MWWYTGDIQEREGVQGMSTSQQHKIYYCLIAQNRCNYDDRNVVNTVVNFDKLLVRNAPMVVGHRIRPTESCETIIAMILSHDIRDWWLTATVSRRGCVILLCHDTDAHVFVMDQYSCMYTDEWLMNDYTTASVSMLTLVFSTGRCR